MVGGSGIFRGARDACRPLDRPVFLTFAIPARTSLCKLFFRTYGARSIFPTRPTACAVGCILSPLRGSADLSPRPLRFTAAMFSPTSRRTRRPGLHSLGGLLNENPLLGICNFRPGVPTVEGEPCRSDHDEAEDAALGADGASG